MKNWFKTSLSALVACSLAFSPAASFSAGSPQRLSTTFAPLNSLDLSCFAEQAVAPSLINPIHPIYSGIKVRATHFIASVHVVAFDAVISWGSWLSNLAPLVPTLMSDPTAISFFAMLPPPAPPESQALRNMKRDILNMSRSRGLWADTELFIKRYITVSQDYPRNSPAWEKAVKAEVENSRLFDWVRTHPDPNVRFVGALLDIHLAAKNYPKAIYGIDEAIDLIKSYPDAYLDLLVISEKVDDDMTLAATIDALRDLGHAQALKPDPVDLATLRDHLLPTLYILARVNGEAIPPLLEDPQMQGAFEETFMIWNPQQVRTGLELLAFRSVSFEEARDLLTQLMDRPPDPEHKNLYVTLSMLAILNILTNAEKPLVTVDAQQLDAIRRAITRTHWDDQKKYMLGQPVKLGKLVQLVGEIIHQRSERSSEPTFLAYILEMAFKDSLGLLTFGNLSHPKLRDDKFLAQMNPADEPANLNLAADIQFSGLIHAALYEGKSTLPWRNIYKFAVPWDRQGSTLSRIALEIIANFIGSHILGGNYSLEGASKKSRQPKKSFVLPHQLFMATGTKPVFQNLPRPRRTEAEYREEIRDYFRPRVTGREHINKAKTLDLLVELWRPHIKPMLFNQPLLDRIPLRYLDIHPDHRCHNRCKYCRGLLRNVPEKESWLSGVHMVGQINDFHALNLTGVRPFVRFSGSIGDPGKNPETWMAMERLNQLHMPWGITMDGLGMPKKMMREMFSPGSFMEWAHVSLDAGSNKSYDELKKNKTHVPPTRPGAKGPYDVVMLNIERMVRQRAETHSTAKIMVSLVFQNENIPEIEALAQRLKEMGVDEFQMKMQHFDERRMMPASTIDELYDVILPKVKTLESARFMLEIMPPDKATAHIKNAGNLIQIVRNKNTITPVLASPINFHRCWVQSWSRTLTPDGVLHACCQVHSDILPSAGNTLTTSLKEIWNSEENAQIEQIDPRGICNECAPVDLLMNRLISTLHEMAMLNPLLIAEFERDLFNWWQIEQMDRRKPVSYELPPVGPLESEQDEP